MSAYDSEIPEHIKRLANRLVDKYDLIDDCTGTTELTWIRCANHPYGDYYDCVVHYAGDVHITTVFVDMRTASKGTRLSIGMSRGIITMTYITSKHYDPSK